MNKIVSKKQLSDNVFQIEVEAPLVAQERKAGQFIILMVEENFGERIPLTISDADTDRGTIKLIYQTVGDRKSTRLNSSHQIRSYAVLCLKQKQKQVAHPVCNSGLGHAQVTVKRWERA